MKEKATITGTSKPRINKAEAISDLRAAIRYLKHDDAGAAKVIIGRVFRCL